MLLYIGEPTGLLDEEDVSLSELENHIDVTISSPSLMLNNVRYIVGEKVIQDQLKGTEVEKKSNKSTDELMVITILSGLAVSASKLQLLAILTFDMIYLLLSYAAYYTRNSGGKCKTLYGES